MVGSLAQIKADCLINPLSVLNKSGDHNLVSEHTEACRNVDSFGDMRHLQRLASLNPVIYKFQHIQ